jgi:PPM family protein phosphatase
MNPPPRTIPCKGLQWSGRTDRGNVRPNNEDAFVALQFDAREVHHLGAIGEGPTGHMDYAFAVSDGMGGAKAGEHASRIAVDKITALMPRCYLHSAVGLEVGFPDVIEEIFIDVHTALVYLGRSDEECTGMAATLSLCWFTPGRMFYGHIGDSRIYYLPAQSGPIRQISHDDTHVGWLLRTGKINERQARDHPRRRLLQKALGADHQFITPQIGAVSYVPGDVFLLCTDGLVESLFDSTLEEFLRAPDGTEPGSTSAWRLVTEAVARCGRDNTTAVVIRAV